ncbi:MAG: FAD-binding oxidoreductase [Thermoleophilaceae bacterium]|nr:FAD-binding oxidoreductase [Thermoleophilaceae bacterium]
MTGLDRREFLAAAAGGVLAGVVPLDVAASETAGATLGRRAARALRAAVRGRVYLPRTPGYNAARLVYNTRYDGTRPEAVVRPVDTRDVAALVRWANRFDERLVARSGGHSYAGYSTTARGVVVDLSRVSGVRVANGRASVGAGTQLIDLYAALARRGLVVPGGSCPSVGIAGLALGGGHGLSGRRFGLTSDNLVAATIVTADGRVRHISAGREEDLYWACRGGGGGNFGIVTSLTFQAHRARGAAWFFISWPWGAASEAFDAWQRLAPHAPPALTSIFSLATTGGSGPPRVSASGQFFGSEAALRRLIRPLTRVGGARLSTGRSSMMALALRWAGCVDEGVRACHTRGTRPGGRMPREAFYAKSDYFGRPLPPRARRRMIQWVERRQRTPSLGAGALLFDAYGGAYNRPAADATAFVHRDMLFSLQYYAAGGPAGASRAWANGVRRALRPFASGQAYQNYIDPDLGGWQRAYYGSNLPRLRDIKQRYDPDFRFRFAQAIPPAG